MERFIALDGDLEIRISRDDDRVARACLVHVVAESNASTPREHDEHFFACDLVRRRRVTGRELDAPHARVG